MKRIDHAEVTIKAFRAIDNLDLCRKFIEGHERVLTSIGIEKITSSDYSWTQNPASYVVICMSRDGERIFGGARIHVCGGNQELPFIKGVIEMDDSIPAKVEEKKPEGTGELCGLWNSMEVAGMGIGAIYVVRATVAIISQLGIKSCFALCSPQGARISMRFGFQIRRDIGNNGTFYYPKHDLLATMVCLDDAEKLASTPPAELEKILELRNNPDLQVLEENRSKTADIMYDLKIQNVDRSYFDLGSADKK